MKKTVWLVAGVVVAAMMSAGCNTGPYTPMSTGNMISKGTLDHGDKVIYWEQADRIPKDVMLESWKHLPVAQAVGPNGNLTATAIPPEVIAAIASEILKTIPQVTSGYQQERMNEALLSRRMLFRGYQGGELSDINKIIQSMGWSIEYMTPQSKQVPPPPQSEAPVLKAPSAVTK